jgi:hypothetical protein
MAFVVNLASMSATGATGAMSASFLFVRARGASHPDEGHLHHSIHERRKALEAAGLAGEHDRGQHAGRCERDHMRPSTKRTTFMPTTGSRLAAAGHPLSIAAMSPAPYRESDRGYVVPVVSVAPGGNANKDAGGEVENAVISKLVEAEATLT